MQAQSQPQRGGPAAIQTHQSPFFRHVHQPPSHARAAALSRQQGISVALAAARQTAWTPAQTSWQAQPRQHQPVGAAGPAAPAASGFMSGGRPLGGAPMARRIAQQHPRGAIAQPATRAEMQPPQPAQPRPGGLAVLSSTFTQQPSFSTNLYGGFGSDRMDRASALPPPPPPPPLPQQQQSQLVRPQPSPQLLQPRPAPPPSTAAQSPSASTFVPVNTPQPPRVTPAKRGVSGTPLLQPRFGGPKTAATPTPLPKPSPSLSSLPASSPAAKRVAATRPPVSSTPAAAAKQDTLPSQFRGWSFRPPWWIYEARPDAVGEERHRPAPRQRDKNGALLPFLTAQLDYCRDRYNSMCSMLETAEDYERQTMVASMAENPRVREELWHEKELKGQLKQHANPDRHFGVTHAATLSKSSQQWGRFACRKLQVGTSQRQGSGRVRAPIGEKEERRRVLVAVLAAVATGSSRRVSELREEQRADESMGVLLDNEALFDDERDREEAAAGAKRREGVQQQSDEQVARLLHVDPPIDAVLISLLSSPDAPAASPSTRRAPPDHSALRSFLQQAMRRPVLRSEDGLNSADLQVSLRQMQPASVSDMLAGFKA